jgi:hypothetical protein
MSMAIPAEKLLTRVFTSRPKIRVLKLFLLNPDEKFRVPDVAVRTKLATGECRRYIAELIRLDLVKRTQYAKETKSPAKGNKIRARKAKRR